MLVKEKWNNDDFEEMGWHDCVLYSIAFPQNNQILKFDIDYIFKWVLNEKTGLYNFFISPCVLTFFNVLDIKINLGFSNSNSIEILEIERQYSGLSSNGNMALWNFIIKTDRGLISFQSTGYELYVKKQPILSDKYNIESKKDRY